MSELIYYMKRRLDADITEEDEDANYKDYSIPRMLMISGHDSTTSADEIFILNALGLNVTEKYIFPRYASQLALEVRAKDDSKKKTSYADYYVVGYFNDEELFNVPADEFIKKVEGDIWPQEKIDKFCGFDEDKTTPDSQNGNNENNGTSENNGNSTVNSGEIKKKKDKAKTAYKVLMSVFICLSAILLATTLLFACKSSPTKAPLDKNYNPNLTTNSLKV